MTRKEELRLIIQKVRNDIASHAMLVPKASEPESDFCLPELKKAVEDLEIYITEYKLI